jgi:UDP-glucuronate decarboxylase
MKKILITGGAGFIGSHLCKHFLDSNFHVTCLDNLSSGNIHNIANMKDNKNFSFKKFDITNKLDFSNDFDFVLNFACPASPKYYLNSPIETANASIFGIVNVLNFCIKNNSTLLHASTSEVYGDPLVHPQRESYYGNVNPIGPRSCYDEGKRVAEMFIYEFQKKYNMNSKIIRIFNTYGPNMNHDDGRVVSNFINQALANEDITIYGDGTQTRSFCYVDDLVSGIVSYLALDENYLGPINLGNPVELNMLDLAEKITRLTSSKSKIIFSSLPKNDPMKRKPDISLAKEKFNFSPKIAIDLGLIKTVDYFKN